LGLTFTPAETRVAFFPLYVKNRDHRIDYQPKLLMGPAADYYAARVCPDLLPSTLGYTISYPYGGGAA
jgi:hypothetical protein